MSSVLLQINISSPTAIKGICAVSFVHRSSGTVRTNTGKLAGTEIILLL